MYVERAIVTDVVRKKEKMPVCFFIKIFRKLAVLMGWLLCITFRMLNMFKNNCSHSYVYKS